MHRRARFLLIQTAALAKCLLFVCLLTSGLTRGEVVAMRALEHLGKPYVLGAAGPDQFDCSGLVMYCLGPEGFEFPLHSAEVIGTDERYPLIADARRLLTGDIVCFDTVRDRDPSDHMGIYLGAGRFVHASSTGEVKISSLEEEFYQEKFTGARRYVPVYTGLPTPAQIGAYAEELGIPQWFESLGIPQWFESLGIPQWFESLGIPQWFESLDIPGKFQSLKEGLLPHDH